MRKVLSWVYKENKNERNEVKATWRKPLQGKMLRNRSLIVIPFKHPRVTPVNEYQQKPAILNEAIISAYQSGSYTMKVIGEYFKIHYSLVSRIVTASKK